MKGLYKTPIFSDCDQDFVHNLASHAKLKILPENSLITASDVKSCWIHIILRGYCILQSRMAGDREKNTITVLKPGDACPVVEALNQVLVFVNVKTITAVELISINLKKLDESLCRFPHIRDEFSNILNQHRNQHEALMLRKKGRLPEMTPLQQSLGPGELFVYDVYETKRSSQLTKEFKTHFAALGKSLCLINIQIL